LKRQERKSILKNPHRLFPQDPYGPQQELIPQRPINENNQLVRETIRTRSHPEIPETPPENDPEALSQTVSQIKQVKRKNVAYHKTFSSLLLCHYSSLHDPKGISCV
jgi:hypothetical protein